MISSITRGLLLSLGLVLATGFTTRTAHAGAWSSDICVDPVTASEGFTGSFFGQDKCEALCKIAAGVCRAAVKNALGCEKASGYGMVAMIGTVCSTLEGVDKEACKAAQKGMKESVHDTLAQDRSLGLANCDGFRDNCIEGCSTPPL